MVAGFSESWIEPQELAVLDHQIGLCTTDMLGCNRRDGLAVACSKRVEPGMQFEAAGVGFGDGEGEGIPGR